MTTIYLVRHCEAMGNVQRIFQGYMDAEISENGGRQLNHLAKRFQGITLDAVYSSPLLRARLTAEAVNRHHGLPIKTDPRLIEINGGSWEGKRWAEIPTVYPTDSDIWLEQPWLFHTQNGESMRSVYDRMRDSLTDIVRDADIVRDGNRHIAVVSHGCAIRNALCWAKGWLIEELNRVDWCDNTAVSVLEFDHNGTPNILLENDNSHLDAQTSTFEKQTWWRPEVINKFID